MISLYPFHIYISFPYSHIPIFFHIHIFLIFMYRYFYRLRRLPCHLCFFHFFILWNEGGVCFSCGFLVSVLWMVFVPLLVSFFIPFFGPFLVSSFVPFFAPLRLSFRPSARFLVSFLGSLSVPPFCSFLRFVRVGWAVRGTRRFCQLFVAGGPLFSLVPLCRGGDAGACIVNVVGSVDGGLWASVRGKRVPCGGV